MNVPEKIALFRSLFRGREDVFAKRFESKRTGKSGYQPACANEWVRGVCEKPKVKCAKCKNRKLLSVTDQVIYDHLAGKMVMGIYPMLEDETCWFLAVDFDKGDWAVDVQAVAESCLKHDVPAYIERSRSGKGAHLWVFFEEALSAVLARKLGSFLLTETMEKRPEIGLDSYDRLFPNQDTLPQGGFGNLIALPLQKKARDAENSVFVDGSLAPIGDQWSFLAAAERMGHEQVQTLVAQAEKRGQVLGVRVVDDTGNLKFETGNLKFDTEDRKLGISGVGFSKSQFATIHSDGIPDVVELRLAGEIRIPKVGMPGKVINQLLRLASFQNPEFYKHQAMRLPTYSFPRVICCAQDYGDCLGLPRGCLDEVKALFKALNIKTVVKDARIEGARIDVQFQGALRAEQMPAAEAMLQYDIGVLSATTAFGKTVVGAWLIAQRGVRTLVLVHRRQLMDQWKERLSLFLGIPKKEIGQIGGGKDRAGQMVDVGIIQSLMRKDDLRERLKEYGHVIVDECHHLSAFSFEQVIRQAPARYVMGLTATVARKDGHHPIILMQCGPVRYRVNAKKQAESRPFRHEVLVRPTSFYSASAERPDNLRGQFQQIYKELVAEHARNQLICDDVVKAVKDGRSPIILTERTGHALLLAGMLQEQVQHVIVMRGGQGVKQRRKIEEQLQSIASDEERVLVATGRYIGEGFDDARLDTLFLVLPVSWRGTIAQYAGRLHRLHDQKSEVRIYDYADLNVPMLSRMFDRRCKGYEAIGYTILLPASAVPGWPTEVPLPVEPEWKQEYAASVRRLIRDGVNIELGNLFVWATQQREGGQGVERARSATEAFLWRRLESLTELKGQFVLNEKLPIFFGGQSFLEVDLLCEALKLAVEIDGDQHLCSEAYRRDRQKDSLLQEQGFFVLRFLAEDVGKRLDDVLDAISRAMARQRRKFLP